MAWGSSSSSSAAGAQALIVQRRPEALPSDANLQQLNAYIRNLLNSTNGKVEENFCAVRSALVSRLTLFNARRGEEGSRLLVKQLEDSFAGVWMPKSQLEEVDDEIEKYLIGKFHLAYLTGKGRKYVPILIPNDVVEPLKQLVAARSSHGVPEMNPFVFGTKFSNSHCSGWHAVNDICQAAGISKSLNATRMRHKVSTLYASLDMSAGDRDIFLRHMGHEEGINRDNYQCPAGMREVKVMGKLLTEMNSNSKIDTFCIFTYKFVIA